MVLQLSIKQYLFFFGWAECISRRRNEKLKPQEPTSKQNIINKDSRVHWPSQLMLENTPTASLQRGKIPPTGVLDMKLNNPIGRHE